jgi:hypothetical protein
MMNSPSSRARELTDAERVRLNSLREQIQAELPELVARNQLRAVAREESTLSGALRRAVYESRRPLHQIAREVGIEPKFLDEFLTGERNLLSDVMNRLAKAVGVEIGPPVVRSTDSFLAGPPPAVTSQPTPGS